MRLVANNRWTQLCEHRSTIPTCCLHFPVGTLNRRQLCFCLSSVGDFNTLLCKAGINRAPTAGLWESQSKASTARLSGEWPWLDVLAQQSQTQTGFWSAHLIPVRWPRAADIGTAMLCLIWSFFLAARRKPDFGANVNTPLCNCDADDLATTWQGPDRWPFEQRISWRLSRRKIRTACLRKVARLNLSGQGLNARVPSQTGIICRWLYPTTEPETSGRVTVQASRAARSEHPEWQTVSIPAGCQGIYSNKRGRHCEGLLLIRNSQSGGRSQLEWVS